MNKKSKKALVLEIFPGKHIDFIFFKTKRKKIKIIIHRWGYNQETEKCEEFNYGGCKGNMNR